MIPREPHCDQQSLWTCSRGRAAAAPLNHNRRTLRRYSILVTSLFKEKCIPGKRGGHDSLFCIRLIPLSPLGQGENKARAAPLPAKAPSGVLSRSAFPERQPCRGETRAWRRQCPQIQPNHRLLLPALTGDQLPQGCAVPRVPRPSPCCAGDTCGLSSSNGPEEHDSF